MDFKAFVDRSFAATAESARRLAEDQDLKQKTAQAAEWMVKSYLAGGRLFVAGNGGSAADAQHIAAEMVGKLDRDRTPLPAYAMSTDTSLLTAVGNDYGYDWIFHRQVKGLMKKEDVFLAITTSGNSTNILKALEACRELGAKSILLTGKEGGKAVKGGLADLALVAPGLHTAEIQQNHIAIYHALCFMTEQALVEAGHIRYF